MAESLNKVLVVRAVGTNGDQTYTMARAATLMEAVVVNTDGDAGTLTIQTNISGAGLVNATAALDPADATTGVVRTVTTGAMVAAQVDLAVGDILYFNETGGTLSYECYAYLYPTPGVAG